MRGMRRKEERGTKPCCFILLTLFYRKKKKKDEDVCRICGEEGHFAQVCTMGRVVNIRNISMLMRNHILSISND